MDLAGLLNQLATSVNIPMLSALLLGLVTAISPCPMATNIAAIAYVSRRVTERKYAVITGTLYTLGRMFSYSLLGFLIIVTGLEIPGVASFLQDFGERILGPLLIVTGLIMLFINRFSFGLGGGRLSSLGGKVANWGVFGGFLLGVLFALAFCPYSAILFFGILIPLALKSTGGVALPAVYAIGTGLPVLVFGILIAAGVSWVSNWFNAVTRAEKIIRIIVSLIFIGVGIYYVVLWIQAITQ
jgi:cytochrome c-type biogenesis protein